MAQNALQVSNRGIQLGQRRLRVEVFKPLETLERERGLEKTTDQKVAKPTEKRVEEPISKKVAT